MTSNHIVKGLHTEHTFAGRLTLYNLVDSFDQTDLVSIPVNAMMALMHSNSRYLHKRSQAILQASSLWTATHTWSFNRDHGRQRQKDSCEILQMYRATHNRKDAHAILRTWSLQIQTQIQTQRSEWDSLKRSLQTGRATYTPNLIAMQIDCADFIWSCFDTKSIRTMSSL